MCIRDSVSGERVDAEAPASPSTFEIDSPERAAAWEAWNSFWCKKSDGLQDYLREFNEMESITIGADVANDKLNVIRAKAKAKKALQDKWKHPLPPWEAVNANMLWNLPNAPAAQVSMLHGIHGVSFASIGACATFGLVLRQAVDCIRSGDYDAAIIGTTDLSPPPELVAGFNAAKVLAAGCDVGVPLCNLRGTHVAGGACTWILAADDVMEKLGQKSLGIEIMGVGLSSDAEHIITPSMEGPKLCIRDAFAQAGITPQDVHTWDMHATGTPGDWSEFKLIENLPSTTVITARKGIFGHGMSTCGGWELTAQLFSTRKNGTTYTLTGSGISPDRVHPSIRNVGRKLATDKAVTVDAPKGLVCGKLSMGIGGISSCVLSKIQ
jgi:3-oxoacyl-[acyl-carrier-protein] synthase II